MAKIILSANTDWYLYNFRLALATSIRDRGGEVLLMSPNGPYVSKLIDHDLPWMEIRMSRKRAIPIQELRTALSYVDRYRKEQPNLVHNFTVKPVIYGSLAARLTRIQGIVSSIAGLGYPFVNPGNAAALSRFFLVPLYRLALSASSGRVIFHNIQDREFFLKRRIARDMNSVVVEGSGVDPVQFRPEQEPQGRPIVLMASRMLYDKGVSEYVQAARLLRARNVHAKFVFAGQPDRGYPDSVSSSELRDWENEGIVEWLGHRDDMAQLMRTVHIVALPSRGEGLPRVLLEASASGKPVVATDIPGCRAVVREGETGLLVPPKNPGALADALETLIGNPDLRARMGEAGRAMIMERFTQDRINREIIGIYEDIMGFGVGA